MSVSNEEAVAAFDPATSREDVYDAEVAPLVAQIIEICRAKGIPFLMTFNFHAEPGAFATSMWVLPGAHYLMHRLYELIYPDTPGSEAAN